MVKAVVVKSWSGCGTDDVIWSALNANWQSYGSIPISIDYTNAYVCGSSFTLAGLEASGADVIILDDPSGGLQSFTTAEIKALKDYVNKGHDLIGTFLTFYYGVGDGTPVDNSGLAPLFGLVANKVWGFGENLTAPIYELRHNCAAKPLTRRLSNPYASTGFSASQIPADGVWSANELAGAKLVGLNADKSAAITWYRAKTYNAVYVANMPEYGGGTDDQQFVYNAIIYPKRGRLN